MMTMRALGWELFSSVLKEINILAIGWHHSLSTTNISWLCNNMIKLSDEGCKLLWCFNKPCVTTFDLCFYFVCIVRFWGATSGVKSFANWNSAGQNNETRPSSFIQIVTVNNESWLLAQRKSSYKGRGDAAGTENSSLVQFNPTSRNGS